ncbi:MAG: DUF4383 domain-containing protein [Candidatus Peribacteraceae bacterium]|nr:DUF4383 domain-containing protein [Candidatus Peribacteraceae bacterium]
MNLLVKPLTGILGVVLMIAGIAGFFRETGTLPVDMTQNIVHLGSGIIGIVAYGRSQIASRQYLLLFGVIYAVIAAIGFVMGKLLFNVFETGMIDNWFHITVAVACLIVSLGSGK